MDDDAPPADDLRVGGVDVLGRTVGVIVDGLSRGDVLDLDAELIRAVAARQLPVGRGQLKRYQTHVDTGRPLHWGVSNEKGQIVETHFVIDDKLLDRMRHMAFEMYESDLARQPVTKDIALDIVSSVQERAEPMGKHEFSKLWETE